MVPSLIDTSDEIVKFDFQRLSIAAKSLLPYISSGTKTCEEVLNHPRLECYVRLGGESLRAFLLHRLDPDWNWLELIGRPAFLEAAISENIKIPTSPD